MVRDAGHLWLEHSLVQAGKPWQAAEKLVNRRLGLDWARLPAVPLSSSKRLTAWLGGMPFQNFSATGVFPQPARAPCAESVYVLAPAWGGTTVFFFRRNWMCKERTGGQS